MISPGILRHFPVFLPGFISAITACGRSSHWQRAVALFARADRASVRHSVVSGWAELPAVGGPVGRGLGHPNHSWLVVIYSDYSDL